jgi:DNA-binding NarL/FixJ family response regulator
MLNAGASGYLLKGSPVEEITDAIVRSARGESVTSPGIPSDVASEFERRGRLRDDSG